VVARSQPQAQPRYLLLGRIADGGMGYVDLVAKRDGRFDRLYACKRLHPHHRSDTGVRTMFLDEARLAGAIDHPNVVSVLDVGDDDDGPFLIMDYVNGLPLTRLIERADGARERIPLQIAVRICRDAALGLDAAHETRGPDGQPLGIVHRDVSPQNVLCGFDGRVVVADFGIAKAFGNASRTRTGILKGNLAYLSPEQLRFEPLTRRSDLFSLGVILYELLAGTWLYTSGEDFEGARRILHEPPPDIGEVREDVPPEVVELLFELLSKDPAERPATANDVARRLEVVLAGLVEQEGSLGVREYLQARFDDIHRERDATVMRQRRDVDVVGRRRARRWRWLLAPAVVVMLIAGLLVARRPATALDGRRALWAGGWHSCGLERGQVRCWGKNNEGQLGHGSTVDRITSWRVRSLDQVTALAAGDFHGCACLRDGRALCWGRAVEGQIGAGTSERSLRPQPVSGVSDCVQVAAGSRHTCVLGAGGRVACFGDNQLGQLGADGPGGPTPRPVPGLTGVAQIDADGDFTCARHSDGTVWCWGANDRGQLAAAPAAARAVPAPVPGLTDALQIEAGRQFGCVVRRGGAVWCWGANDHGQLGDGTTVARSTPAAVGDLAGVAQVAAGQDHVCALRGDGKVLCWGGNWFGALGSGDNADAPRPAPVSGIDDFVEIAAGVMHTCGRHRNGVSCWGRNGVGQLGDGTREDRWLPVSVNEMAGLP
jgi:serine/threonine-protein kinase